MKEQGTVTGMPEDIIADLRKHIDIYGKEIEDLKAHCDRLAKERQNAVDALTASEARVNELEKQLAEALTQNAELLEALEGLEDWLATLLEEQRIETREQAPIMWGAIEDARAAIAKAKGASK